MSKLRDFTLDQMVQHLHNASKEAGWWDELGDMKPEHRTMMYASKIALIHSEVSEMLEGLRKGNQDDHLHYRKAEEVEAADIFIRLADYCGARGLDLAGAVVEKAAYNAQRSDHKRDVRAAEGGKKF